MSTDFDTRPPAYAPPPPPPPPAPEPPPQSPLKRAGSAIAGALALIISFAGKLKAVLLLLPKIKLLTTSASMLVSIGAYALIWGWQFAVGFVLLLFVHEMGHVIQLRREGVPASAPMFIPFLGAVVGMKRCRDDAAAEARVGLAGPVLGSIACLVPLGLYAADRQPPLPGARVHRLLPEPLQPRCRSCRSTAAGRWRRSARGCGSSASDPARRRDRLPQPDHDPDPAPRRLRDLPTLQDQKRTRSYYRVAAADADSYRCCLRRAGGRAGAGMDATHLARTFGDA